MKTNTSKLTGKIPAFSDYFNRRLRESGVLIVVAIALYFLLALLSHNNADPTWVKVHASSHVSNSFGWIGAFIADFLLYLFGYLAYLLPIMMFYSAWWYFRHSHLLDEDYLSYFLMLRLAGFLFIFLAGCALGSLHWRLHPPWLTGGGLLGRWIAFHMVGFFSHEGAHLILVSLLLVGVTLFTGLSWVKCADSLGEWVCRCVVYLQSIGTKKQWRLPSWRRTPKILQEPFVSPVAPSPFAGRIEPKLGWKKKALSTPIDLLSAEEDEPKDNSYRSQQRPIINPLAPRPQQKEMLFRDVSDVLPPLSLLDQADNVAIKRYSKQELEAISRDVEVKLQDFGIQAQVVAVYPGPVVTRFELQLAAGTKVSRITSLDKDLARSLSVVSVRVVDVIPGKSVIGLELPNQEREIVRLREILASSAYETMRSPLALAMGKDIAGHPVILDLAKMPHLLVAGTTGSGKSVGLNAMLISLLYKATPEQLRLILIDPKMLELSIYDGIPHLLTPVVTDMKDAANALRWCVMEMDRRYRLMAALGVRNLSGYNVKIKEAEEKNQPIIDPFWEAGSGMEPVMLTELPYIVVVVDEFADMMMVVGKKVEELIARIAQKARAAGIHLILATQRPSVDVITGLIKANIPTRVAFQVSSRIDSRTILDQHGAEQLLGHGDMLYLPPGTGVPIRTHGAFVADDEVHRVVSDIKSRGEPQYLAEIVEGDGAGAVEGGVSGDLEANSEQDPLYDQAVQIVLETRRASISHVQRRLKIGYNRAANIIEAMEAAGLISAMDGSGGREILAPSLQD